MKKRLRSASEAPRLLYSTGQAISTRPVESVDFKSGPVPPFCLRAGLPGSERVSRSSRTVGLETDDRRTVDLRLSCDWLHSACLPFQPSDLHALLFSHPRLLQQMRDLLEFVARGVQHPPDHQSGRQCAKDVNHQYLLGWLISVQNAAILHATVKAQPKSIACVIKPGIRALKFFICRNLRHIYAPYPAISAASLP